MAFVKIETGENEGGMCGGFLIREDVVVTAAHCNCNLGNITVLLGAHNVAIHEQGRKEILVHRRILHPEFNDATFENDIMLLQLKDKAKLTQAVGTISLSQREVKKKDECSMAGWGLNSSEANAQPSPTLQEVDIKVMGKDVCLSLPYLNFNPAKMLCVGDPQESNASFRGDSGGPLVCHGKVKGIVSYDSSDGSAPTVFTKVSKYVPWIKKILHSLKP
nr:granzyme B(G,H)-like [Chrysemys picta bellii]